MDAAKLSSFVQKTRTKAASFTAPVFEALNSNQERQLHKLFISIFLSLFLFSCNDSDSGDSKLISYDCSFVNDGVEGCWASKKCATAESGQISSRIVLEVGGGELQKNIALYFNESCSGQPDEYNEFGSGPLTYEHDSTVISSEGIETDLYQFIGYTLISIEGHTMCFSKGVYEVTTTHDFTFFDKDEASLEVDFENCVERI